MDKQIDNGRAWKDEEYRNSLTPEQLAQLPTNLTGDGGLSEEDLENITGGKSSNPHVRTGAAQQRYNEALQDFNNSKK